MKQKASIKQKLESSMIRQFKRCVERCTEALFSVDGSFSNESSRVSIDCSSFPLIHIYTEPRTTMICSPTAPYDISIQPDGWQAENFKAHIYGYLREYISGTAFFIATKVIKKQQIKIIEEFEIKQ